MFRIYDTPEDAIAVAKRATWNAWLHSAVVGMGIYQDRGPQPEDVVWQEATSGSATAVNCDYIFGRMMKLYFMVRGNEILQPIGDCRSDYQSWCRQYRSYDDLFNAAEKELHIFSGTK